MKILPTTIVEHAPMPPRGDHQLRFGQLNAHNFFDTRDDPSTQDPVLDRAAYREHVSKLAAAIRDGLGAPDVITMQEVENVKVLKDLVASEAIRISCDCNLRARLVCRSSRLLAVYRECSSMTRWRRSSMSISRSLRSTASI